LPALREGTLRTVLITGLGGAGKSTLATRLARILEAEGLTPIPVSSSAEKPLSTARLLQICGDSFLAAGQRDAYELLRDSALPEEDRLRYIVSALNAGRYVLVLDNFETNLDETSRRILTPHLAAFYTQLLSDLVGDSRALITCRYRPADVSALPAAVHEQALGDFPEGDFLKFLLRDPVVERRYYAGELPQELLSELHRLLGGTPRFLEQMRQVLNTIAAADLRQALTAVHLPAEAEPTVLAEMRDRYCEQIFAPRLYSHLPTESQRALSRAAVYDVSVNLEALAAVTGEATDKLRQLTREWQAYAFAYPEYKPEVGELWTVYGLLRGWLLAPERLSLDERCATHRAAGDFLSDFEQHNREGELGLSWVDCLIEARAQFLAASAYEEARSVTYRISGFLVRQGLHADLVRLNQQLLDYEEHPRPMNWLGRSYLDRGDYATAREWYQRCRATAADGMPEETATAWHGLATTDLRQGNYVAVRDQFTQVLTIYQQIGDRSGEAATWYSLGFLAKVLGKPSEGVRLVVLCYLIDQAIDHTDTDSDWRALAGMASELHYTQEQIEMLLQQVAEAYEADRGRGLLEAAFGHG
jgi:tetratricopeptide (TPR) repeat protein